MRERDGVNREGTVAWRIQNDFLGVYNGGKVTSGQVIFQTIGFYLLVQIHWDQTGPKYFWDQRIRTQQMGSNRSVRPFGPKPEEERKTE
jgi:hypothetical protein